MKKTSFSFRAVRAGGYLHRFFLGKMSRRRLQNATVGAAAAFCFNTASAQCNMFKNADAANPLLAVTDKTKNIAGFAFADIDADGDKDVYVSYYDDSDFVKPVSLHLFRNIGTSNHPVFQEDTLTGFGQQLAGNQNEFMQFVDIDGDGDLDFFNSGTGQGYYYERVGMHFYENVGNAITPDFVVSSNNPVGFVSSYYSQPFAFADIDSDGDYDFYAATFNYGLGVYWQRIYYNEGTVNNPVFNPSKANSSIDDDTYERTYYDWNKDGLMDYFTTGFYSSRGLYYKNVGPKEAPKYVRADSEAPLFKNFGSYRLIDLNNDGAPEAFNFSGRYSTLAPVAVIEDTSVQNGNKTLTILSSKNHIKSYTYRWELNGKTIPKANDYYLVARVPGTYTLYVTSECGTGVSLNYEVTKNAPLLSAADSKPAGFANNISKIGIKAYPNPFIYAITLQLPGSACTVRVTDMVGKILITQTTSATTLQLGERLKAGTYIIEVWDAKKRVYQTTTVKQ